MNKTEIALLTKAKKNCIKNAEMLLCGNNTGYPLCDDIKKADTLIDTALRIEDVLSKYTVQPADRAKAQYNQTAKADAGKATRELILAEAAKIVTSDREQQYGKPESNFELISCFWSDYINAKYPDTDICLCGDDVAVLMALLKIARIATGHYKEDSYIDACGYIACGAEIAGMEGK